MVGYRVRAVAEPGDGLGERQRGALGIGEADIHADEKLYYVDGLFDRAGQLVGQEHLLDMSLPIP